MRTPVGLEIDFQPELDISRLSQFPQLTESIPVCLAKAIQLESVKGRDVERVWILSGEPLRDRDVKEVRGQGAVYSSHPRGVHHRVNSVVLRGSRRCPSLGLIIGSRPGVVLSRGKWCECCLS